MGYLADIKSGDGDTTSRDDNGGDNSKGGHDGKTDGFDYLLQVEFVLGYLLALCGIVFQLYFGFSLPFPLNVILFPITIIEYMLVWIINNSSNLYAPV